MAIVILAVSVTVSAYTAYQSDNSTQNHPAGPTNNSTTNGENNGTPAPQSSSTPTPTQTNNPEDTTPPTPLLTPGPTSRLPDDCHITYSEWCTYDTSRNVTEVMISLEARPDFSSRNSYVLYPQRFYLTDNGNAISTVDPNATSEGILLNENYEQTATFTITVLGNYTSNNYDLAYYNPPPILFVWKRV